MREGKGIEVPVRLVLEAIVEVSRRAPQKCFSEQSDEMVLVLKHVLSAWIRHVEQRTVRAQRRAEHKVVRNHRCGRLRKRSKMKVAGLQRCTSERSITERSEGAEKWDRFRRKTHIELQQVTRELARVSVPQSFVKQKCGLVSR